MTAVAMWTLKSIWSVGRAARLGATPDVDIWLPLSLRTADLPMAEDVWLPACRRELFTESEA